MRDAFGNVIPGTEDVQPGDTSPRLAPTAAPPPAAPPPAPPQDDGGILSHPWQSIVGGLKAIDRATGAGNPDDLSTWRPAWQTSFDAPVTAGGIRAIKNVADPINTGIAHIAEASGVVPPGTAAATAAQNQRDLATYNRVYGSDPGAGAMKTLGEFGLTGGLLGGAGELISGATSRVAPAIGDALDYLLGNKAVVPVSKTGSVVQSVAQGAGQGAGAAAVTSGSSDQPYGQQVASGGTTGAWLGPLFHGVGSAINTLRGVTGEIPGYLRTLGQKAEDMGISIPWQNFNTAPGFRAVKDIGSNLPLGGGKPDTTQGVEQIHDQLNGLIGEKGPYVTPENLGSGVQKAQDTMNTVAGRTTLTMDPTLDAAFTKIENDAALAPTGEGDQATKAIGMLRKQFADPGSGAGSGTISGGDYRNWTQANGGVFDNMRGDGTSPSDHLVNKTEDALDGAFHRSAAPGDQDALSDALTKYRIAKTLEPAVTASAQTGVLNPSTLDTSVTRQSKRWDPSTGGIGYGDPNNPYLAKLNDLSDIYKNFFGRTSVSQAGPGIGREAVGGAVASGGLETAGHYLGLTPGLLSGLASIGLGGNAVLQRAMNSPQVARNIVQSATNPAVRQAAELQARLAATQATRAGTLSGVPQAVAGGIPGILGY